MPGVKRDAETAFGSVSTLLSHFAEGDTKSSQASASALTRLVYASRKEPLAAWAELKGHLERQNGFPELLSVLNIASRVCHIVVAHLNRLKDEQTRDQELMTSALNLCAAILALQPPTIVDVQDSIKKALMSRESNHLASLSKALSIQRHTLNTAALRVIRSLLQSGSRARRVWEGLSLDAKVLSKLLSIRRSHEIPSLARPDIRTLTIFCLMPLLSTISSSSLKAEVLGLKGLSKALFAEIQRDPVELLDRLFEVLYYGVLTDERLDSELKMQLVTASWEPVLALLASSDLEEKAVSAHRFLLATVSLLAGKHFKGITKSVGILLGLLKPIEDERHAQVLELALRSHPELLSSCAPCAFAAALLTSHSFWKRFMPLLEPRLSLKWLSSMTIAVRLTGLPLRHGSRTSENVSTLLDQSLPSSFSKQKFSKALQGGDGLVSYMTATFLLACLTKARGISTKLKEVGNQELQRQYRAQLSERVPDAQVIISLVQKAGSGTASDSISLTSTASEEIEANSPILSTCLQLLELYFELLDPNIRFDFGKFSRLLAITDDLFACAAQASLLRILRSPLATFNVQTALALLIRLHLDTKVPAVKELVKGTLSQLLERSPLFEHDAREVGVWLDAFSQTAPIALLSFFESCAQECFKEPWRHAEAISLLFPRPISPLVSVMLQRAPDMPDPTDLLAFLRHLAFAFVRLTDHGIEIAHILVNETAKRMAKAAEGKADPELELMVSCIAALEGTACTGVRKQGKGPNPSPITQNIVKKAKAKAKLTEIIDDDVLVCHAIAARQFHHPGLMERLASIADKKCLIDILLGAAHEIKEVSDDAVDLIQSLVGKDAVLLAHVLGNTKLPHLLSVPTLALRVLRFTIVGKQQDVAPDAISLLHEQFSALLRCGELAAGTFVPALPELLPLFSDVELLSIADALLMQVQGVKDVQLHIEAIQLFLRPLLSMAVMSSNMADLCFKHFRVLYDLHAERQIKEAGELLARGVEHSMPRGLIYPPFAAEISPFITASQCRVFATFDEAQMTAWTRAILSATNWDEADARILTAAIYRLAASRQLFREQLVAIGKKTLAPVLLLRPLHAFLEIAAAGDEDLGVELTTAVSTILDMAAPLVFEHEGHDLELFLRCCNLGTQLHHEIGLDALGPVASQRASPSIIRALAQMKTQEGRRLLAESLGTALLWLVRRYAEDEIDSQDVLDLAAVISAIRADGKALLVIKESLVDPVIQAIIKNRFFSVSSLQLAANLVRLAVMKDATYLLLLRQIAAHTQLRAAVSDEMSSASLLELIDELARASPESAAQSSIAEHLMPAYGATSSANDQLLLRLFRLSEQHGGRSIRHALSTWAPAAIRKVQDARGVEILMALNPDLAYRACLRVLRQDQQPSKEAYDPGFLLTLLGVYLEEGPNKAREWLGLAGANVISLAVCCLSSSEAEMHSVGDRCLAKLANRLEESEFTEKEEFILIFDHIRAAVNTESPLPALAALFYARCLRAIATPEDGFYPIMMPFLLQRPLFDLHDVPLLYQLLFSREQNAREQRKWLLELLRDGLCSSRDWLMLKRRQTIDLLLSLLSSRTVDRSESLLTFAIIERAAELPIAANDLIGRRGLLSWPLLSPAKDAQEALFWLRILEKASKSVERARIDPAKTGLWLTDLILASEALAHVAHGHEVQLVHLRILRRVARYAQPGQKQVIGQLCKVLLRLLETELPTEAVADLHDAAIRCIKLGGDEALFEPAVGLALAQGGPDVRQWMLSALHPSQGHVMMQDA